MSLVPNNTIVQHIECVKSALNSIPIVNGQLIYVSDNQEIYWDTGNIRKQIIDIIILNTDNDFDNLLTPLTKFYYVKESNSLYYYTGTSWLLINSGGADGTVIIWGQLTLNANNWVESTNYFSQQITINGASSVTQVDLLPNYININHMLNVGCVAIYIENDNGILYARALGNKPTENLTFDYNAFSVDVTALLPSASNAINEISYDTSNNQLQYTNMGGNITNISLNGMVHNATYDATNSIVNLPIVGGSNVSFPISSGNSFTTKLDWTLVGDDYTYTTEKTSTSPITWVETAKLNNVTYATKTTTKISDTQWTIRYICSSESIDETISITNVNGIWTETKV